MARWAQLFECLQNVLILLLAGLLLTNLSSSLHLLQGVSLGSLTDGLQRRLLLRILLGHHFTDLLQRHWLLIATRVPESITHGPRDLIRLWNPFPFPLGSIRHDCLVVLSCALLCL